MQGGIGRREVNTAWQVTFASKSSADTKAVLRAARAMARNCMISILNFLEWESVVNWEKKVGGIIRKSRGE